ncbi:hypothetical protein [Mycobacterium sp. IDR2000157661]|uniref:hypothetical protein n=1 Tax=Mycobacterium sp. IDR2000157661 TaxID=2867005 RepID=UPI001EECC849|nr:hypothetical protein [Mycobacterium sp. IDR2000157661]ULE34393.1 hypothetical protein K3G64_07095 [Mycobacterium sp. IDR2000157661]
MSQDRDYPRRLGLHPVAEEGADVGADATAPKNLLLLTILVGWKYRMSPQQQTGNTPVANWP